MCRSALKTTARLDPSDEDGRIDIHTVPVRGMYQPDAIAAFEVDGETFVVSANEGDARDYEAYSEEARRTRSPKACSLTRRRLKMRLSSVA